MATRDRLPGFCRECFCEVCWTGFYAALKDALLMANGRYACTRVRCAGEVATFPPAGWARFASCHNRACRNFKAAA